MKPATSSYVEQVAIRVHDVHRHIRCFYEVLCQMLRNVDASVDHPMRANCPCKPATACRSARCSVPRR